MSLRSLTTVAVVLVAATTARAECYPGAAGINDWCGAGGPTVLVVDNASNAGDLDIDLDSDDDGIDDIVIVDSTLVITEVMGEAVTGYEVGTPIACAECSPPSAVQLVSMQGTSQTLQLVVAPLYSNGDVGSYTIELGAFGDPISLQSAIDAAFTGDVEACRDQLYTISNSPPPYCDNASNGSGCNGTGGMSALTALFVLLRRRRR